MIDTTSDLPPSVRDWTVELVGAYVSNANTRLTPEELQSLIRETYSTLSSLTLQVGQEETVEETTREAVSKADIRKSIASNALISFEDGRPYKSLKRHLNARGLSAQDYRAKWGLPSDYPMVHPTYSAQRSELAKAIGLGARGRKAKVDAVPAPKMRKPRAPKA